MHDKSLKNKEIGEKNICSIVVNTIRDWNNLPATAQRLFLHPPKTIIVNGVPIFFFFLVSPF